MINNNISVIKTDVAFGFASLPFALYCAWGDTKAYYRRTLLGPFWIVMFTGIGVAVLGVFWSTLLKMDKATFIPSVTVGLVVWQLISGCITESSPEFLRNAMIIRPISTSFLLFPVRMVMRHLINFMHNAVIIVLVLWMYPTMVHGAAPLLAVPGLLLVLANLLWMCMFIGMASKHYSYVDHMICAIMTILFLLSSAIYPADHIMIDAHIVWSNPFTYFISVIRDPLRGVVPDAFVYCMTVGMLVVGWSAALWTLHHGKERIGYWN